MRNENLGISGGRDKVDGMEGIDGGGYIAKPDGPEHRGGFTKGGSGFGG